MLVTKKLRMLLLCVYFCVLQVGAFADSGKEQYWVLGSYVRASDAMRALHHLENKLGQTVSVAKFTGSTETRYRLLVSNMGGAIQKNQMLDLGVESWEISIYPRELEYGALDASDLLASSMDYFLILASFRDKSDADQYADRIRETSEAAIEIQEAEVDYKRYFRVAVGPYNGEIAVIKQQFSAMGLKDIWWLSKLQSLMILPLSEENSIDYADSESVEIVMTTEPEVETEIALRPPSPFESYVDYCVYKATPREREKFCADGQFKLYAKPSGNGMQEAELTDYCSNQASGPERKMYCNDEAFRALRSGH